MMFSAHTDHRIGDFVFTAPARSAFRPIFTAVLLVSALLLFPRHAAADQTCRMLYTGVTNVYFYNGLPHSVMSTVKLPCQCDNPTIVLQPYRSSVLCGTGAGWTACPNTPSSAYESLHAYVGAISKSSFKVFLSGDNGVWVGAISPPFPIAYEVTCGEVGAPVCNDDRLVSGSVRASFTNGRAQSSLQSVDLPAGCKNPAIITQSTTDSVKCGTGAGAGVCPNTPTSFSEDVHSYVSTVTDSGFKTFLSGDNGVWNAQDLVIGYHARCENPVGAMRKMFAGTATVAFYNGRSESTLTPVTLPESCLDPVVTTQSYYDSVYCGTGAGAHPCLDTPTSWSQDVFSRVTHVTPNGFDLYLSATEGVWVGAVSPPFEIAWHVVCRVPGCD